MDNQAEGDDTAVWAAARVGDGDAFGTLFDRHHARVRRHVWRLVPHPQDADDVTATVFLELWRRRADARLVQGSLLPWLLVTATNAARNATRATRRYEAFLARLPRPDDVPDIADATLSRDPTGGDRALAARLRAMRPDDLRLLALVVLDDVTLPDAAAVLGLSPSAAKSRLHRAKQRLRASFGADTHLYDLEEVTR